MEYGIDDKPQENAEDAAAEGTDLKNVEEVKSKESPESASPGPQKTVSDIIKSKVKPYVHPAMKSKMEKTLEQSRCLVLQFINRLISEGMDQFSLRSFFIK